jgi:Flp pilus assembly pilin Flp
MSLRFARRRRGFSAVQYMLLAALIIVVVMGTVQIIGWESNDRLESTSGAIANPANLKNMMK